MELLNRVSKGIFRTGILGMGYVGLPLAIALASKGLKVFGVDTDFQKIANLKRGNSHVLGVERKKLLDYQARGLLFFSQPSDPVYREIDIFCLTVPTPLTEAYEQDLSYLKAAMMDLLPHAGEKLVILESSSYPGTTEELLLPLLARKWGQVGEDFFLACSPERVDPGNKRYNFFNTPRVVGGVTENCLQLAMSFYGHLGCPLLPVGNPRTAEMAKLLENSFRAVNIALINELGRYCHRAKLDIWEVVEVAASKPFGFKPFYPGPGAGGHCIPVDPLYLMWDSRRKGFPLRFINLAWEFNLEQPEYIVNRLKDELDSRGMTVKGTKFLILGITYKENVADLRESPALYIMEKLRGMEAEVSYSDPYVDELQLGGKKLKSKAVEAEVLKDIHCAVFITAHSAFNTDFIRKHCPLIFDCRNIMKKGKNVVTL